MPSLFGVRRRDAGRQPENATWISGVAAGAGKLISFVFNSNDRSTTSSLSYSSEDTDSSNSDEYMAVSSKEPDAPKQVERKLEPVKDFNETSTVIISEINSKHALEQMIMQETFTRDEGHDLIKLIESRVVDAGNSVDTYKKLPEEITYPSGGSPFREITPDLRSSAVVEAKKWLEEKRLAVSSNVNSESGPSNTLPHDSGGEDRLPTDVAKSFMQSLSPSSSPSLVTTPSCSEYAAKGLKRNYHTIESDSKIDEIRKVRLNSTDSARKMSADNEVIQRSPCSLSDKAILDSGVDNAAQLTHETSSPVTLPSALNSSAEAGTLNHDTAMQGNSSETPLTVDVRDLPPTDITLSQDDKTVAEIHDQRHSTIGDDSSRPIRRSSARKKQSVPVTLPSALNSSAEAGTLNHDTAMQGNSSETPQDLPPTDITLSQDDKTVAEIHGQRHSTTVGDDSSRPIRRSSARKKQSVPESSQQDWNILAQSRENELKNITDGSSAKLTVDHNVDGTGTSNSTTGGPLTRSGLRKSKANKDPLYKPPQRSTASRGQGHKSAPKARRSKAK